MPLGTFDRDDNLALLHRHLRPPGRLGSPAPAWPSTPLPGPRAPRLVERDDFGRHLVQVVQAGARRLRYLQNGDVRLVYEALRERQRLLRNAPHLVTVLPS